MSDKHERLESANELIGVISDYGRRFFYNKANDRVAHLSIGPRGHLYFHDDYSGRAIYIAYNGHWRGWSHGGTLRDLVRRLADYVRSGSQLSIDWIGPTRFNDTNIWGYSEEEMAKCRAAALKTEVIAKDTQ